MNTALQNQVLSVFRLNDQQKRAVVARGTDVVVTAGAGSGKTSTLVARYLHLLTDGLEPRRIAAITFTKKAAFEMQSRVRIKIEELKTKSGSEQEQAFWSHLAEEMDGARIGTIHSLCAEILRNHPAEAGVDPRFGMLEDSMAANFQNMAVEETLAWMVTQDDMLPVFRAIRIQKLEGILLNLLQKQLEVREAFNSNFDFQAAWLTEIRRRLKAIGIEEVMREIEALSPSALEEDCGNFAPRARQILNNWQNNRETIQGNDALAAAQALFDFRRDFPDLKSGKRGSEIKAMVSELKKQFDENLAAFLCDASKSRPDQNVEATHAILLELFRKVFIFLTASYQRLKDAQQALDFDDLEYYTQQLLRREPIRERWQTELQSILVDEYQDTNQRQREIVNTLAGSAGRLFVVGDMRQSIYRFRRADVTVFRQEQGRVKREGGLEIPLDLTYRSHKPLLDSMGYLLKAIIGTEEDPNRPHFVPFTAMEANRQQAPEHLRIPPVEFILGQQGEEGEEGRRQMADALAVRLIELKGRGILRTWDEVAVLCRASSSFPYYEAAFERARIPFVTVAGKGFYERPEIRDILNILRYLADPGDKTALVGLLRSPAFGISDTSLFELHKIETDSGLIPENEPETIPEEERRKLRRVKEFLNEFKPLVDRMRVGELIVRIVDWCDYRAILSLQTEQENGGSSNLRLWRNLDKLIGEAISSNLVSTREFLERIDTFSDSGAREGEAVNDAEGAVSIMTIHKSKGLEFPIVVLGDAGRRDMNPGKGVIISPQFGISLMQEQPSLAYLAAKTLENDQEKSEKSRLLYVALTRAKDLLIVNGHLRTGKRPGTDGWCKDLLDAANLAVEDLLKKKSEPTLVQLDENTALTVWCPKEVQPKIAGDEEIQPKEEPAHPIPLFNKVRGLQTAMEEDQPEEIPGPITPSHARALLLGRIVHKLLQRWIFPSEAGFDKILIDLLNSFNVADLELREYLTAQSVLKLEAFASHPIFTEILTAAERYSELPYIVLNRSWMENRIIDLLYRANHEWTILDFKTDPIESDEERNALIDHYRVQVWNYKLAMEKELGQKVRAKLCFLSDRDQISIIEL